jgi:hypothetical protein
LSHVIFTCLIFHPEDVISNAGDKARMEWNERTGKNSRTHKLGTSQKKFPAGENIFASKAIVL